MSIKVGDRMPQGKFRVMTGEGAKDLTTDELFKGKRVLVFSVPGAFTPTCSAKHLPGYISHVDELRQHGIDTVACMAVNDVFVMAAWGKSAGADDKVMMLADGNADYARALGLDFDASDLGLGTRSRRFALVVKDGVVEQLNVEAPGEFKVSAAEHMLGQI